MDAPALRFPVAVSGTALYIKHDRHVFSLNDMTKRLSVISISGFALPSKERETGLEDIARMRKKFQGKMMAFHDLELINALTSDRVIVRRKGEIVVQEELERFFHRSDISHFIVHYTGHGSGTGAWFLPDWSRFTLERILDIWSRHCSRAQKLLLIIDSCSSGDNVDKLNRYHQKRRYLNVEMIAASYGEAKYRDFVGSYLTEAICSNKPKNCPVGTICTHSLKSNLSELVEVKRDHSKRYLKFKWKLSQF